MLALHGKLLKLYSTLCEFFFYFFITRIHPSLTPSQWLESAKFFVNVPLFTTENGMMNIT